MMDDYRDLVLQTEIKILNHLLDDKYNINDVKDYKFQRPELKPLFDEIIDIHANNHEPVIQALWDKYPIVYGSLTPRTHSDIKKVLAVAKLGKARIYTYNKMVEHLGMIATTGYPLEVTIDNIIHDMKTIKGALYA